MRFHPLIQNSSRYFSGLKRVYHTQTLTSTEYHISSIHSHFWGQLRSGSPFLPQKPEIIAVLHNNNSSRSFLVSVQIRAPRAKLTKVISIGSYSPEVRDFGTLIMSTKALGL